MRNEREKNLLKMIGLQFFAESEEDFEDDFDDVPEFYGWDHADEDEVDTDEDVVEDEDSVDEGAADEDDAEDAQDLDSEDGADEDAEDADGKEAQGAESAVKSSNEDADGSDDGRAELISELKALGYVGDDLTSLAADIKKRREDADALAASEERRAKNTASKGHISSAKPAKTAGGDGAGGFSSKQVRNLQQTLGCSYEKARDLLAKQVREIG